MFYWDDNVIDPNVKPLNSARPGQLRRRHDADKVDDYTVKWTFKEAFPKQYLYTMAYGGFCPLPAHYLKPQHPKYSANTYEQYTNAFPPDIMNFPVMGAWVPVEYRPDDIVVMRRNPYYWKVDEAGNQLPYLDEMEYKLSTWADRDVQAVAGTGDFSNLEQAESYVEALKRSADPAAPARLAVRCPHHRLFALSEPLGNGWGEPDARGQAVRELNRNTDFRMAVTSAIDRQHLGDSLVKGPFTAIYPGGLYAGTAYYDKASTVYYPFDLDVAKAELAKAGLKDTDGNGIVNFPADVAGGQDVSDHAARQRRLRDRQEPRRRRGGVDGSRSASASSSTWSAGANMTADAEQRQVGLAGLPQRLRADLGGAEHRQPGPDRTADQLVPPRRHRRHRRSAARGSRRWWMWSTTSSPRPTLPSVST